MIVHVYNRYSRMLIGFNCSNFLHTELSYHMKYNIKIRGLHAFFFKYKMALMRLTPVVYLWFYFWNILNICILNTNTNWNHQNWRSPCIKIWYYIQQWWPFCILITLIPPYFNLPVSMLPNVTQCRYCRFGIHII